MQFWTDQKLILSFYHHCTRPVCERFELTQAEFDILMFLTNNPEYDTAADIVRIRLLTKSHVSMAIKNLKKRGFLAASFNEHNKKSMHLMILPAAQPAVEAGKAVQKLFQQQRVKDFTAEEKQQYKHIFEKICHNARTGMAKTSA